eukprot:6479785-Amphidinium_carterae.1
MPLSHTTIAVTLRWPRLNFSAPKAAPPQPQLKRYLQGCERCGEIGNFVEHPALAVRGALTGGGCKTLILPFVVVPFLWVGVGERLLRTCQRTF